jgi:hypothetical protein
MGKYSPLREYLLASESPRVRMTFAEVEALIGEVLPASACRHPGRWANEDIATHSPARAWLNAGYETQRLDLSASAAQFVRSGRPSRSR